MVLRKIRLFFKAASLIIHLGPEKVLKLEDEAVTDSLTGLLNRRGFYRKAKEEVRRFERYGHPFSILFLDIDGLKGINDSLGHKKGDEVIISLSDVIKKNCRKTDFAARIGGDEFLILLTETDEEKVETVVDRIRSQATNTSIGYDFYDGTLPIEDVIYQAEMMMYWNKRGQAEV
ncbi:MAG: GGDEF domain-containing protein [Minisyncoccales bacterium]|jgi:diguanylate cyclase (GGDEF)-like protein